MKDWFKSPRFKKIFACFAAIFVIVFALSVLVPDNGSVLLALPHSLIFTAAIVYCIFKFIPSLKAQYQGFKERRRNAAREQEQWEKEFEQSFEERVREGADVEMAVDPMPAPPPPAYEGAGVFEKGGADLLSKLEKSAANPQQKQASAKRRPQDSFASLKEEAQQAHVKSLKKQQGKEVITTPMIILCNLKSADGFMIYAFSLEYKMPLRLRSVCRPSGAFIRAEILTDRKDNPEACACALDLVAVPVSTSSKLSFYDEAAVVPGIKWHYVQTLKPCDLEKCLQGDRRDLILDDKTPYLLKEETTQKILHEHISLIKVSNFSFGPEGGAFDYEGRHFEGFGGRLGRCRHESALLLTALEEHDQYYIKSVNAVFPLDDDSHPLQ